MANILGLAGYVQQQGELGRQRGTQQRLNRLAGQAVAAPDTQTRNQLVQQAVATNPDAGFALQDRFQQQDDTRATKAANVARYMLQAVQSGDQAMIEGTYRAIRPFLQEIAPGREVPESWTPELAAQLHQAVAAAGGQTSTGAVVHSQRVGQDGYIYNTMRDGTVVNTGVKADRQMWFRDHPGMAPELVGKDGSILPVGGVPAGAPAGAPAAYPGGLETIGGQPVYIDPSLPPQVQAQIRAYEAADQAVPPQLGSARARPSEAQIAAQTEAARRGVELQYAPAFAEIEAEAARQKKVAEAEGERASQAPKRVAQYQQALTAAGNVETSIDRALGMIGPGTTGFIGARMRGFEGSPAYNLAAEIETVKANLGFDRLQQMRDNSPTGGALGAIAVQELIALQSTIANLDPNQGAEQLRTNLQRVKQHYANWRAAVQQALADEQRGGAGITGATQAPGNLQRVQSPADYNALPSGAQYIAPDGSLRRKR